MKYFLISYVDEVSGQAVSPEEPEDPDDMSAFINAETIEEAVTIGKTNWETKKLEHEGFEPTHMVISGAPEEATSTADFEFGAFEFESLSRVM